MLVLVLMTVVAGGCNRRSSTTRSARSTWQQAVEDTVRVSTPEIADRPSASPDPPLPCATSRSLRWRFRWSSTPMTRRH